MTPYTIKARGVNEALGLGLLLMDDEDRLVLEHSRNGEVRVHNGPVIVHTSNPLERVLFCPLRDANPFFHLFESMWMLAGRNDLPWLAQFNKRMAEFSDDGGKTQPAAYGFRWRKYFGYDQIDWIVSELGSSPGSRRVVLTMWDAGDRGGEAPAGDLYAAFLHGSKDVPCNTQCYFTLRDGELHMAVTCRSNDLLWGAHGANAVHFSILLEYIAARLGARVGTMTQFSWNYHLYPGVLKHSVWDMMQSSFAHDLYEVGAATATPIFSKDTMGEWEAELDMFLERGNEHLYFAHPFLSGTAAFMRHAWAAHKERDYPRALRLCESIRGDDWRTACTDWITRRMEKFNG